MTKSGIVRAGACAFTALLATAVTVGALEFAVRVLVPVRNVGPSFTTYDPVYGKRLKANFHATRIAPDFTFAINTNSLGMRDPEPAGAVTGGIVFVGDSFTMGYGVNDDEAFPALIRAELIKRNIAVPVVNTGLGDNGNGRWIKFFDHDAAKFRPRVVVLQVMANDFNDNLHERLFQLDVRGKLQELPVPPLSFGRKAQALVEHIPGASYSYLMGLSAMALHAVENRRISLPGSELGEEQPGDDLTFALVDTAVDKARATGADVIGLLVGLTGPRREKIRQIFAARGLTCLDTRNKADSPSLYFKTDGHWNASGHRRAAELLLPHILRRVADPSSMDPELVSGL
jgi:hypothetical protein